jgi:hypothetical protein
VVSQVPKGEGPGAPAAIRWVSFCGFPPLRQEHRRREGEAPEGCGGAGKGWVGFVVSHPCDKNKDVARMGHPRVVADLGKEKPPVWAPAGVVFLVDSSVADSGGESAIFFREIVLILNGVTNYFRERGLTSFPQAPAVGPAAGTCGAADCAFGAIRAEGEGGWVPHPSPVPKCQGPGAPGFPLPGIPLWDEDLDADVPFGALAGL